MNAKAAVFSTMAIFLYALTLQAQSGHAVIEGRVLDASRAPIASARIALIPNDLSSGPSARSDEEGRFSLTAAPGIYTLRTSAVGFSDFSRMVELHDAARESQEIVLEVAGLTQTVNVTASPEYQLTATSSATKTLTPLRDIPQSITVVTHEQVRDQLITSMGDLVRYIPGITAHQGENNRDQIIIRGNNSSADFFVNGIRDDVQYYRDFYNLDRVEALKGPNAMIFGRGGGGGVINRVTKEAEFMPLHEITMQGGSYNNKRIAADIDEPLSHTVAFRLNSMFEDSGSFRDHVSLDRYGLSPSLTIAAMKATRLTIAYENFRDRRTADRGIPSFQGRPADVPISTFYGNPDDSHVRALVNIGSVAIEHEKGRLSIRSRLHVADYDRSYQNFVPGAVTADKNQVSLSAYNNATRRMNLFNQTDVTYAVTTGRVRHTLVGGVEAGRQLTDNLRNTGFFNNSATSILVPYADPTIKVPVTFRQSGTDADNHLKTSVGAVYVQDQVELSRYLQLIGGVRFDHFDLRYHNNRTSDDLRRIDNLTSPRAGAVLKPVEPLSIYGSYSISYLPSSGDQFSSLTTITQQVKPEKFTNYEVGVKWDLQQSLSITTAVYRLNRTNTRASDPNDPTRIVQTGSQRTNGYELGLNGSVTRAWKIAGGYAYQDAFITSATISARPGAQVAQVPHHTFSIWNNYQVLRKLGIGIGVLRRSEMFAAIDNTVVLPGYTTADAALFVSFTERTRLQANVENVFNKKYYLNADNNTNISPGFPRALRMALIARF